MARPKEFDRYEALKKAMAVFWEKGYDGTSLPDLMKGMGISRSSLYETFGDKQALFKEAMECYLECVASKRMYALKIAKTARRGIKAYFEDQIRVALDENYPDGCFFTNVSAALGSCDSKTGEYARLAAARLEKEFHDLLRKGQDSGEFSRNKDVAAIARCLTGLSYGMNILAPLGKDRKCLEAMVKAILKLLE